MIQDIYKCQDSQMEIKKARWEMKSRKVNDFTIRKSIQKVLKKQATLKFLIEEGE